ncbi:MAG: bifunctional folylpolyglutamate synthase/dihydrofolate synthase [Acidimicrobiales bacterium]
MDYRQALAFLDAHTNLEGSPAPAGTGAALPTAGATEGLSLAPIRELMAALADPQHAYRVIHVTGTNGKGSTSRFAAEILAAAGLSVGLLTSPDLERINERIVWDGRPIPDEEFARVMSLLAAVVPTLEHPPGRFDLLTALALVWFADQGVDVAVVEVGLLGRFDSTNIVEADVAVLTNLGKDHTDGAEGWKAKVAWEKAGIIEPDSHVVLGTDDEVFLAAAQAEPHRELWVAGRDFALENQAMAVGGRALDVRTPGADYEQLFLGVHGAFQPDNLVTAIAAVEALLGRPLGSEVLEEALADIELPGRFEVASVDPLVILDGAHNPDGARAAKDTLDTEFARLGSWVLVFGLLNGKDPAEMLEAIGAADFDAVILTQPAWSRSVPATELAEAARSLDIAVEVVPDAVEAFARAKAVAADDDLILVAGSLYLVGEVRPVARSVVDADDFPVDRRHNRPAGG